MPIEQIIALLVALFNQWGMPKAIRTDNGLPFGVPTRDVVPMMSLWLKAWNIEPILNRPRTPTDNPNVENNQHTASRWAEVYKCQSIEQMERQLDEAILLQRDYFQVSRIGYATRRKVYKGLYYNPRTFRAAQFDHRRAYQMLAKATYPRRISANGVIALYDKNFSVGFKFRGQITLVKFSSKEVAWICRNQKGDILKTIKDDRFSKESLFNLLICQRT